MSLVFTSLGSVGDTADRSSYTVALSRAPAPNTLVLVGVMGNAQSGDTIGQPSSVSGAGIVFSLVTSSVSFSPSGLSAGRNLSLWRGMADAPEASVISVAWTQSMAAHAMLVTEVSGVSQSGTSGANAVAKSATSLNDNNSSLTVIGPSATSTGNGWFFLTGTETSGSGDSGVGYVDLDHATYVSPFGAIGSGYTTLSTGTIVTIAGNSGTRDRAGILVEIVLNNPAVSVSTSNARPLGRRFRLPPVPKGIKDPVVAQYLNLMVRQLNNEGWISIFSAANPNTSGWTGVPGSLALNVGSASTATRLWVMEGSVASVSTNSWRPLRIA